jgi:ABC-type dipeptide/oligopeptide/nickel transport system permease component
VAELEVSARVAFMGGRSTPRERLAGAFVLAVLGVACLAFWIGIPLGILWALGELTDSFPTHFVGGLLGVPIAMAAFSPVLFWLNGLYLRVTGILARLAADEEESGWHRRVRGPLEPMLMASFLVALVALFVWFFVFAENPPRQVI